jgi:dihydrofolate reductase
MSAADLHLIVALGRNRVIGRGGALPWRLPNDLQHFKRLTLGCAVLMGRKTWESLGRPLPQRDNWVLTRDPAFAPEGARVFHSLQDALASPAPNGLMVIGGADLYAQTLPLARRLYLTEVDAAPEGDAHFPAYDPRQWREVAREAHPADEHHAHAYTFITLERG